MSPRRRRRGTPLTAAVKARIEAMRAAVRAEARDVPGVYRMCSPDGEVIYVGKSKRLRTRLLSYFRASYPKDKGARILREAATLTWEPLPSEFAALLQELRYIKALRPRYNVAMKRDARYHAFVRITNGPAPMLEVVRGAGDDEAGTYYGPFRGAIQLEEAIRELNDVLGLRDCAPGLPMRYAEQLPRDGSWPRTPGCLRHEIGKCLGPCIGAVQEAEYLERFGAARAFLEGRAEAPLVPLRARMTAASEALEFARVTLEPRGDQQDLVDLVPRYRGERRVGRGKHGGDGRIEGAPLRRCPWCRSLVAHPSASDHIAACRAGGHAR